jgi:hypothetical protein
VLRCVNGEEKQKTLTDTGQVWRKTKDTKYKLQEERGERSREKEEWEEMQKLEREAS